MKKQVTFILCIVCINLSTAQSPQEHEKTVYVDESGRTYINKDLPIYLNISTSPDKEATAFRLKSQATSKYANPMYLDAEGYNSFRAPWAVDPETKTPVYPKQDIIFELYADSKAPNSQLVLKDNQSYEKDDILYIQGEYQITLEARDKTSGVANTYLSVDKAPFQPYANPINISAGEEHLIQYYSVDHVGNVEKVQKKRIIIDQDPPQSNIEIKGDKHQQIISARSQILINSKDKTGVKTIYYQINNQKEKKFDYPLLGKWFTEGEHEIHYYAIDQVGNKEKTKTFSFFVDKTPPTIVDEIIGNSYIANGKEFSSGRSRLKLTAFDNKAGIKEMYYSINNGEFKKYTDPVVLNNTDGNLSIKTYGMDQVNNRTETSQSTSASGIPYIDMTGPSLTIAFNGPNFKTSENTYINPTTKVILKGEDNEAGLNRIEYALNNASFSAYIEPFSIKKKGAHEIKIQGIDNVDNSNQKSFRVFVDDEGPEIDHRFSTPPLEKDSSGINTYPPHVVLFLTAMDQSSGFENMYYSINGTPLKIYKDNIRYFKKNKTHQVDVKAIDKLGNSSKKAIRFSISK